MVGWNYWLRVGITRIKEFLNSVLRSKSFWFLPLTRRKTTWDNVHLKCWQDTKNPSCTSMEDFCLFTIHSSLNRHMKDFLEVNKKQWIVNNQKWSAGVGEAPHRHCWNLRNRLRSSCPGIWNGQTGVGTDYSFRYNCHGESTGSFCVWDPWAVFLGRQQANQYDPCQSNSDRCWHWNVYHYG